MNIKKELWMIQLLLKLANAKENPPRKWSWHCHHFVSITSFAMKLYKCLRSIQSEFSKFYQTIEVQNSTFYITASVSINLK